MKAIWQYRAVSAADIDGDAGETFTADVDGISASGTSTTADGVVDADGTVTDSVPAICAVSGTHGRTGRLTIGEAQAGVFVMTLTRSAELSFGP